MKAHDSYLTALLKLSDAVFSIPVYQRNYDWDTNNCLQLFRDIEAITLTGKDHFIGSIVYVSIGTATEPYYNIIDGQQRITSIMLFLKALHDISDDLRFKKQIRIGFLINQGLDDQPKMKLKQVESDSAVYEKIIFQEEYNEDSFSEAEKKSNVFINYKFFREQIEHSKVKLQDLYNAIFKLEIIDVCLVAEDPQEVFESMNSTGKNLTNTDLLRNYLLMNLTHSKQEKFYKKYWLQIEKGVGTKLMEQYMVHYLIMKRKSDSMNIRSRSSKVNKNTLYDCFKIYFPSENKQNDGTEELLADMLKYSVYYRKIVNAEATKTAFNEAVRELIYELNAEPAAIFIMYLLDIQEEQHASDDDILEAVKACISYVFRVRLFRGSIANQFFALAIQYFERCDSDMLFMDKVWKALTSGQGSYRFPKNREFQDAFGSKDMYLEFKPAMLRYILYKYERGLTKEVVESENATVEHILPQDTKKWLPYLNKIHDTSYSEYTHRIGNLTLTKMNTEASNSFFDEKKKIYEKSGYAITRQIAKNDEWNSHVIKKRSETMAEQALQIWTLPDKYNQDASYTPLQDMDDDVEDLYNQLCELIHEYYPSMYEEQKKLYLNFLINKKVILSIIPCQSSLSITLNSKISNLTPNDRLEDISEKGHWGVGDSRLKLLTSDDVWLVLDYIEQVAKIKQR